MIGDPFDSGPEIKKETDEVKLLKEANKKLQKLINIEKARKRLEQEKQDFWWFFS